MEGKRQKAPSTTKGHVGSAEWRKAAAVVREVHMPQSPSPGSGGQEGLEPKVTDYCPIEGEPPNPGDEGQDEHDVIAGTRRVQRHSHEPRSMS